jgi:NADH-quinone oxidoreductase subunit M
MHGWPLLSLVTFLPLVGAGFILMIRGEPEVVARNARYVALWTSLITFVLSLFVWFGFERGTAEFQFVEKGEWMPAFGITYHMGVDGISMMFVLLSTILTPICVLASWESITHRVKEYMIAFLVLETLMVGMFCALDFVAFYMFFEGVLIPMSLFTAVCGAPLRLSSPP